MSRFGIELPWQSSAGRTSALPPPSHPSAPHHHRPPVPARQSHQHHSPPPQQFPPPEWSSPYGSGGRGGDVREYMANSSMPGSMPETPSSYAPPQQLPEVEQRQPPPVPTRSEAAESDLLAGLSETSVTALRRYATALREAERQSGDGQSIWTILSRWFTSEGAFWRTHYNVPPTSSSESTQTRSEDGLPGLSELNLANNRPSLPTALQAQSRDTETFLAEPAQARESVPRYGGPPAAPSFDPSSSTLSYGAEPPAPEEPAPQPPEAPPPVLEPVPALAQALDVLKQNELKDQPGLRRRLAELESGVGNDASALSKVLDNLHNKFYSQEANSYSGWYHICYSPAAQAMSSLMPKLDNHFYGIMDAVVSLPKGTVLGQDDMEAWMRLIELTTHKLNRFKTNWESQWEMERRNRECIDRTRSWASYEDRTTQAERHRDFENAQGQAHISRSVASEMQRMSAAIHAALEGMLHHTNAYLRDEILAPAIRQSVSTMPEPPDPKDVDNTPPLIPKGSEALTAQIRKASDAVYALARVTDRVMDRLTTSDRDVRRAVNVAELDEITASAHDRQDGYQARSKRTDEQGAEEMALVQKQGEEKKKRTEDILLLTKGLMDRVVKWEKDRINELLLKGAQGPGGAAFLSGAFATQHSTAMNTISNTGSSNMEWKMGRKSQPWGAPYS